MRPPAGGGLWGSPRCQRRSRDPGGSRMTQDRNYWTGRVLGRRQVLRGGALGTAGLAAAALIGCGGSDDKVAQPQATLPSGAGAVTTGTASAGAATATPAPKDQIRPK